MFFPNTSQNSSTEPDSENWLSEAREVEEIDERVRCGRSLSDIRGGGSLGREKEKDGDGGKVAGVKTGEDSGEVRAGGGSGGGRARLRRRDGGSGPIAGKKSKDRIVLRNKAASRGSTQSDVTLSAVGRAGQSNR